MNHSRLSNSLALLAGLLLALHSSEANALGPLDLETGLHFGYGLKNFDAVSGDLNRFGLGLGAKAGVTLVKSYYLGVGFTYYLGETNDTLRVKANSYTLGADLGYQIDIEGLTVRPYLSAGLVNSHLELLGAGADKVNVWLAPSVMAEIGLGIFYVGADARLGMYFYDPGLSTNLGLFGMAGVRL